MTNNEALSKAMKLCSVKEYAVFEIHEKLLSWGVFQDECNTILKHLQDEKFIDEFRMARFYANDKLRFNKWGRVKIKFMLQQKKVDKQAISQALDTIEEELYQNILSEELHKKNKSLKDTDPYIIKAKLYQFATGRGFESEIIYRNLNKLV